MYKACFITLMVLFFAPCALCAQEGPCIEILSPFLLPYDYPYTKSTITTTFSPALFYLNGRVVCFDRNYWTKLRSLLAASFTDMGFTVLDSGSSLARCDNALRLKFQEYLVDGKDTKLHADIMDGSGKLFHSVRITIPITEFPEHLMFSYNKYSSGEYILSKADLVYLRNLLSTAELRFIKEITSAVEKQFR